MTVEELVDKSLSMSEDELMEMLSRAEELMAKDVLADAERRELTSIYLISRAAPVVRDAYAAGWTKAQILAAAYQLM